MKHGMTFFFLLIMLACATPSVSEHEFSGNITCEGNLFFHPERLPDQDRNTVSIAFQPEYYHDLANGSGITIVPFARFDAADRERTHADFREFNLLWVEEAFEIRLGIGKVFWGVTEFVHLVDLINQTDAIESIDGEDKLGQPMVQLSIPRNWGTLNLFALPYFRERTFAGKKGRLRPDLVVETDLATFEDKDAEHHPDFAIRYSHTLGDADFGLYYFDGTNREPLLRLGIYPDAQEPRFCIIPHYAIIRQAGLDAQYILGEWLLKLEAIHRWDQPQMGAPPQMVLTNKKFWATTFGFEYTIVRLLATEMDLGLIGEYVYDERRDDATTPFQNDAMAGFRLTFNDLQSTEILAGCVYDLSHDSRMVSIESSRRLSDNFKLSLTAQLFLRPAVQDLLYSVRDDDFVRLEMAYYF